MNVTIGFTGTRNGMTNAQKNTLRHVLDRVRPSMFRHGDCIGADEEAHGIVKSLDIEITTHPPSDPKHRAYCDGDGTCHPKGYLERNRDIVDNSNLMLATPKGFNEERRSGTWSTIRYTRRQNTNLIVIYPDGTVSK